ncbi:MAG: hypothetical protein ABF242_02640 [Flavobacteriales bacterium]
MKNLFLTAILSLVSLFGISQSNTVKAFFTDFDSESKIYSFESAEGDYLSFDFVAKDVLAKFPLNSSKLEGRSYLITYSTKTVKDEQGDDYDQLTITKLQEIKLVRTDEEEEED